MKRHIAKLLLTAGAGALAAVLVLHPAPATANAAIWPAPPCPMPNQVGVCDMTLNVPPLAPLLPLDPALQPKFIQELPVPVDYVPDKTTFPGMDYYEIAMAAVSNPGVAFPQTPGIPAGSQWTGLVDPLTLLPLYTPVWGYGQVNMGGGVLGSLNGGATVATWPAMNFRAQKGTPVKVKWVNRAPDQHLLCPDPANSNVPCAIDRTLMGTKVDVNDNGIFEAGEMVNPFGGPQQPDNAMVIHLHGGEIPPDSDGFAELWVGNANTAKLYNPAPVDAVGNPLPCAAVPLTAGKSAGADGLASFFCGQFNIAKYQVLPGVSSNIAPPFTPNLNLLPAGTPGTIGIPTDAVHAGLQPDRLIDQLASAYTPGQLMRPKDHFIFYNYPMVQDAATIWYHDHALGKTRVNVAAGPAGFFIVEDPAVENAMRAANEIPKQGDCTTTGVLAKTCYDIPIALQDRAFNADGSINFPNGLGQANPAVVGWNPLLPSAVPTIHPQWVPEYFGDVAVVNGVIWPKLSVEPRAYRFRLLGGSNARCYVLGLKVPGLLVQPSFTVIATEQGYMAAPAVTRRLHICPGERYDVVVDFSAFPPNTPVFLTNSGAAPYPNGAPPNGNGIFGQLGELMRFDVVLPLNANPAFLPAAYTPPLALSGSTFNTRVLPPAVATREMVLNEVLDALGNPVRVQIDGKAFEDPVTETPKRGTVEIWKFINTTVDAHPIHLHLVQFKVLSRQKVNVKDYGLAIGLANLTPAGGALTPAPVAPFLLGGVRGPDPFEIGWKDTVRALPGEVTTVMALWDGGWDDCDPVTPANTPNCRKTPPPQPAVPGYVGPTYTTAAGTFICQPTLSCVPDPVTGNCPTTGLPPVQVCQLDCVADPLTGLCPSGLPPAPVPVYKPHFEPVTSGPYVWHCHIVDHEDNEMMRPSLVIP